MRLQVGDPKGNVKYKSYASLGVFSAPKRVCMWQERVGRGG